MPAKNRGIARAADADVARPVTRRRRMLGMLCDVVGIALVSFAVSVGVQAVLLLLLDDRAGARGESVASVAGTGAAVVLWLGTVAVTGRSVGDLATRVRYTDGVLPAWLARLVRFVVGAGGYTVLSALPFPFPLLATALAVVVVVLLFVWPDGRGLAGWIGRRRLVDDRAGVVAPAARD